MGGATLGSVEGKMDDGVVEVGGGVLGCGAGGGWTVGTTTLKGCVGIFRGCCIDTLESGMDKECCVGTLGSGMNKVCSR